jgi:hypothetical protein
MTADTKGRVSLGDDVSASQVEQGRIILWDTSAYSHKVILVMDWKTALALRNFITEAETTGWGYGPGEGMPVEEIQPKETNG